MTSCPTCGGKLSVAFQKRNGNAPKYITWCRNMACDSGDGFGDTQQEALDDLNRKTTTTQPKEQELKL